MPDKQTIKICCGEELIRQHLYNNESRGVACVMENARQIYDDAIIYDIAPGVVSGLIANEWLIPYNRSGEFTLDRDREAEWEEAENARIARARSFLEDRFGKGEFDGYPTWDVLHHPASPDQDSRGFVFTDTRGYKYLVCEAGRVMPLLKKLIAA